MKWIVVPEETHSHAVTLKEESTGSKATVKWDGCTHFYRRDPMWDDPDEETCYHHICELDAEIARLQALKERALLYFDGEFGLGGWEDDARREAQIVKLQAGE